MAGFYRSSYKDEAGETKYMATTQMEPTDARRVIIHSCEDSVDKNLAELQLILGASLFRPTRPQGHLGSNSDCRQESDMSVQHGC